MAAAPATAARTFFQYAHPGGAGSDAHAVFDARGPMDLHVTREADIAELVSLVPAERRPPCHPVMFPLLDVSPAVADLAVGASAFSAAWSRTPAGGMSGVLQSFVAARSGRQGVYPAYMHAALAARAAATDAQLAAPVDSRGFLMQLTYGSMRSQHGLLSLARLVDGLMGCHATHRARAATGLRVTTRHESAHAVGGREFAEERACFEELKRILTDEKEPVLMLPDFKKPSYILFDAASTVGYGAVLCQMDDNGHESGQPPITPGVGRTQKRAGTRSSTRVLCYV
ncbi:hypothetical protein AB1Y20_005115 [Prymnesium parvum]|uniref:Reverse transcriptase/retrotransposon-derived protein RNase H-like domain-containing protein n=1 Tax=Prymnesium parvum TaxID=97485 RepID=A0AB34J4X8_PRYPA